MKTTIILVVLWVVSFGSSLGAQEPFIFAVPGVMDPFRNPALRNDMKRMVDATNAAPDLDTDPKAVNEPLVLRAVDVVESTSTSFQLKDGTNNPVQPFSLSQGSSVAPGYRYTNSVPFPVDRVSYEIWLTSATGVGNFYIAGNVATNHQTGAPKTFGAFSRGDVFGPDGSVSASYTNAQNITNLVNVVTVMPVSVSFKCSDSNSLNAILAQFRDNGVHTLRVTFTVRNDAGQVIREDTKTIDSIPRVVIDHDGATYYGQRNVPGITNTLRFTTNFVNWESIPWKEGQPLRNYRGAKGFYQVCQSGPASPADSSGKPKSTGLVLVVEDL